MDASAHTLFDVLQSEAFDFSGSRSVFLNAVVHPDMNENFVLHQHFKPYAETLEQAGFVVNPDIPSDHGTYYIACVLLPKNIIESRFFMAHALKLLRTGGVLICAANNKAGGGRIKKLMQYFGLNDIKDYSKNKARCAWATVETIDEAALRDVLEQGAEQKILDAQYLSQPGVFGWNKIDKGSEILAQHFPHDLKGRGADFGCGYGYLSDRLLTQTLKIKTLTCLDADHRALKLCENNLSHYDCAKRIYLGGSHKTMCRSQKSGFYRDEPAISQWKEDRLRHR